MKKTKNICAYYIIYIIIIFPFLRVGNIIQNENFLHIMQIVSSLLLTILVVNDRKTIKINPMFIGLTLFTIYEVFISIFRGTLTIGILFGIYFRFLSIIYLCRCIKNEDYDIFRVISLLLNFLIIINFPSIIKSFSLPEYQKVILLGGKNGLSMIVISAMFFEYLSNHFQSKKMTIASVLMLTLNILTLLLCGSSTGLIIGLLILIYMFFGSKINIKTRYYVIVFLISLVLVLNTELIQNIDFLYDFITKSLNKNLTFTGRTQIWEHAIRLIKSNLFGYGRGHSILLRTTGLTEECHNATLELLLSTGIPGLILYINYLIVCLKPKSKMYDKKLFNICISTIFAFFIIGLTESVIYTLDLWWIIAITYALCTYFKGSDVVDNSIYSNV